MIACILPPNTFMWDNLAVTRILDPYDNEGKGTLLNEPELCYLAAILNSFVFDFALGMQINANLSFFIVYGIPVPRKAKGDWFFDKIIPRVARLSCVNPSYAQLWEEIYLPSWVESELWYEKQGIGYDTYGPVHEKEIRENVLQSLGDLTPIWSEKCTAKDWNSNKMDITHRSQFRAELDALVAHLYSLSREDFTHILDTFEALKRKEVDNFGEFVSKRKCLEEYDRLTPVIEAWNDPGKSEI